VKEKSRLRSVFGGEDIVTEGKNGKRIGLKRLTELLGRKTSRGTSIESFDLSPSTHKAATGAWADIKGTSESPVPLETSKPTELPAEPTEAPVTPQKAKQSIKILDGERSKGKISTEQPIEIMRSGPTHEEQGVDNYSNMKEINTEDAPKTPELKTSSETSNRSEELVRMAIDTAKKKSIPKLEADLKGINEQLLQDPESEGLLFRKVAILEALAEKKTGK